MRRKQREGLWAPVSRTVPGRLVFIPGGVPSHTHWTDVSSSQALMDTLLSLPSEARSQTGELLPSTLPDPSLSGNTAAAF